MTRRLAAATRRACGVVGALRVAMLGATAGVLMAAGLHYRDGFLLAVGALSSLVALCAAGRDARDRRYLNLVARRVERESQALAAARGCVAGDGYSLTPFTLDGRRGLY